MAEDIFFVAFTFYETSSLSVNLLDCDCLPDSCSQVIVDSTSTDFPGYLRDLDCNRKFSHGIIPKKNYIITWISTATEISHEIIQKKNYIIGCWRILSENYPSTPDASSVFLLMYKRKREQEEQKKQPDDSIQERTGTPDSAGGSMGEPPTVGEVGSTRMYACLFCRRGFTSAQALGGHMNVHRRDRALLRQSALNVTASSNRKNDDNNVSNLQLHGHVDSYNSSNLYVSSGLSLLPCDHQPDADVVASAASQPSSFLCHLATRASREKYRPEHCLWNSSKMTQIMDQPQFNMELNKSEHDDDGVDLELRLGEKP